MKLLKRSDNTSARRIRMESQNASMVPLHQGYRATMMKIVQAAPSQGPWLTALDLNPGLLDPNFKPSILNTKLNCLLVIRLS